MSLDPRRVQEKWLRRVLCGRAATEGAHNPKMQRSRDGREEREGGMWNVSSLDLEGSIWEGKLEK